MAELPRPLGLFLQGGGALGAWQAGALEALDAAGARFDVVMGYSIGAVNGAALALGRLGDLLRRWREAGVGVMRPSPRLAPFSLFTLDPLRGFLGDDLEDARAKGRLGAELHVVTACPEESATLYARFTPGGAGGWDGPLAGHLMASCAIPLVFPEQRLDYRGRRVRLIDGGIPMGAPLDLSPLSRCAAVLSLEMVRPDELGRCAWTPWGRLEQASRETGRLLTDGWLARFAGAPGAPPLYRLHPSRRLEGVMLDFRSSGIRRRLAQGVEDARAFLAGPERWRAR